MSLTRIRTTGKGRLSARLVIEGLEYEFVSAKRMERTTSDSRIRVAGLDLADMVIGASADLMRAQIAGTGFTAKLLDLDRVVGKRHGRVTRAFFRSPTVRCFLAANVTVAATSITLRDAQQLPSSGVVHIGTEAIRFTSRTSTVLTVTGGRGAWGSTAQGHYTADGEGLSDALVTDQPLAIEGRRAFLYLYGDGDDPQGDGTLRWRGICASDARWSRGHIEIAIDPLTRLLSQPLGGDLATPMRIRGIHYTSASPWSALIAQFSGTSELVGFAIVDGFFETQAEFITAANAKIVTAISDAGITIGDGAIYLVETTYGYDLIYRTDSTSPLPIFVTIQSQIDARPGFEPMAPEASFGWQIFAGDTVDPPVPYGDRSWTPTASRVYSLAMVADLPRATLGLRRAWNRIGAESLGLESDYFRIYLGGLTFPTANDAISFGESETPSIARVYSVNTTTRSAVITDGIPGEFVVLGPDSEVVLARNLASGNVLDVLAQLVTDSPLLANTGAMPLVVAGDFVWENEIDDHVAASRLANHRGFYLFEGGVTLAEVIEAELLAVGCYLSIDTSGAMEVLRIRPPLATDAESATITATAGYDQTIERSPHGVLAQLVYRVGYDPLEDEWDERTLTFRDVQSVSPTRSPITLEVAQRSTDTGSYIGSGLGLGSVDRSDVARLAMQYLGLFGMPTAVVTVPVDARYMDVRIGDSVSLTSPILPDIEDGVSEISDRSGLVVASTLEVATGRVMLGILMHTQRFAGYSPGLPVASQVDNGGNEWDVTITLSPYTDLASIASWLAASDLVRVSRAADDTADVTGTVVSIVSATVVRVQFDAVWTPGAFDWGLRSRLSTAHASTASLARFAFVGNSTRRVAWASSVFADAQVFA